MSEPLDPLTLDRLRAYSGRLSDGPTIADLRMQLRQAQTRIRELERQLALASMPAPKAKIDDFVQVVADVWGVRVGDIYGQWRERGVVLPRFQVYALLRERMGMSYPRIGQKIGGRDYSTAHSGYRRHRELLKTSGEYAGNWAAVLARLGPA